MSLLSRGQVAIRGPQVLPSVRQNHGECEGGRGRELEPRQRARAWAALGGTGGHRKGRLLGSGHLPPRTSVLPSPGLTLGPISSQQLQRSREPKVLGPGRTRTQCRARHRWKHLCPQWVKTSALWKGLPVLLVTSL